MADLQIRHTAQKSKILLKISNPSAVFPPLALLFGVALAFLIPPFQSPDEPNHLLRAYQVSEGVFFPEKQNQRLGGTLPASLAQVRDSFSYLKMNDQARLDNDLIFRSLHLPLQPKNRTFLDFPNTAIYAPTAYLPQATAIALLRPFGATPLQMLYAARLANLFVWAFFVLAAIRLMPFLKNMLAVLALLPASLVIAASANADVITNGLCWWLVAAFCAGGQKGFKILAGLIIVCVNKLIALPLVILHWLINPSPVGRGVRDKVIERPTSPLPSGEGSGVGLAFAAASLATALAWGSFAQKNFVTYDNYNPTYRDTQTLNEGVDPARQQSFIIENTLYFIKVTSKSMVKSLPSMAAHFVGKFGWEKNYLHPIWLTLLWLVLAAMLASEENPLSWRQRILAGAIVALYLGMFAVTMYALWCPVGASEVTNFQGRYFVPIAPVAALALASGWLKRFRQRIEWGAILILAMSNLAMIADIWHRYYA